MSAAILFYLEDTSIREVITCCIDVGQELCPRCKWWHIVDVVKIAGEQAEHILHIIFVLSLFFCGFFLCKR